MLDGAYSLSIGPNARNVNLRDFIDQNGTFASTGNAMNQDRDRVSGENLGDRFLASLAISTSDNGDFIRKLYRDLMGRTPDGREPTSAEWISQMGKLDPAWKTALGVSATSIVLMPESRDRLISMLYQRYLRRLPLSSELNDARTAILAGTQTHRGLVMSILGGVVYFNDPSLGNSDNQTWLKQVYRDVLGPNRRTDGDAFFIKALADLNANRTTRGIVARSLVLSDAGVEYARRLYFEEFLGRVPMSNNDPFLTQNLAPASGLRTGLPAKGKPTPDERLIIALVSSPEYFRLTGNTSTTWITRQADATGSRRCRDRATGQPVEIASAIDAREDSPGAPARNGILLA